MVRAPFYDKNGMKRGAWSEEEDNKLRAYVIRYGHWNWRLLPKYAGLARCGKSCRLRWVNYLKPGVKKGNFTKQEEDLIVELHAQLGQKWSAIAERLPGRTDNDIKNFWHTRIQKRAKQKNPTTDNITNPRFISSVEKKHSDQLILSKENGNESASFNANSPVDIQQSSLSLDADLWSEILDHNTDYTQNDQYFPPLSSDEEFFYSSSSESSYDQSALKWIANNEENSIVSSNYNYIDQTVYGDYWSETFASDISNHRSESFIYYDHGMNLFN